MARLSAQPHQNYNYSVEQPSLRNIRNQVEWKSDNYRIEEITSIQTGRRGADTEWAGPTSTWIKIWEGYLGRQESQAHTRPPPHPGFQCQENVSTTSGCKNKQGLSRWRRLLEPQVIPLGEPTHGLTYSDSLPLSSSTRVAV